MITISTKPYKYQTNTSLIVQGELGVNGSNQLVVGSGAEGTVTVVGNPPNSTPVPTLIAQGYAEEVMDIASAQTLGTNFIFLNGSSFDTMGVGGYEFEESNGLVYGLYGRTDGLTQQVYYSGATNNTQVLQYTTVAYVPPFLNGNIWQAAAICGSDLQGFTVVLRDTSGANLGLRYIYVRHNGSLINSAGHTYVEITPMVNSYLNSITRTPGGIPRVVRVGAYFFISLADWQFGSLWLGGWNAQDSTYPQTSAALPGSSPTYTPTQFTITTNGLPGGDITTGQTFPILFGNSSNFNASQLRLYNMSTGAVSTPTFMNAPVPLVAGWATNISAVLEGEVDSLGNPYLAFGTQISPGDANNNNPYTLLVNSIAVQFTAGSAGAYTNAQLNYVVGGASGSDLNHVQPAGSPIYIGYNGNPIPNESVASNAGTPSTCVNKLPICGWFLGEPARWSGCPTFHWYYSGTCAVSSFGTGSVTRGIAKAVSAQAGSLAAAQANKLAQIYPMFNVVNRVDFNASTGTNMTAQSTQPSGQMISNWWGRMVGPSMIFSQALSPTRAPIQTISILPANTQITDMTYNRFGTAVPGFKGRIAEYVVNLPNLQTTLSTWCCVWPTGMANINQPTIAMFPCCTDSGPHTGNVNSGGVRLGNFSLSGSVYQPPPVVWNYASNMLTQLAALKTTAISVTQAAHSDFGSGGTFGIEIVPILNSAANGIAFALGIIYGRNAANSLQQISVFTTPCGLSGTTINLTNTSSVTLVSYQTLSTSGVPGVYDQNDSIPGNLDVVYPAAPGGDFYVAWTNANSCSISGDSISCTSFMQFNSSNAIVNQAGTPRSKSRGMLSCSAQHHGIAIMPYRDGDTVPEADIPISRYATTTISTQADFAAGFNAALANPSNIIPGSPVNASYNIAEMLTMESINNQFLLQVGSISGRLNHKQYSLPSTFIDMTSYAAGTYYLYLADTGAGGVQLEVDSAQRPESSTSMYFGSFDRTSTGFANQTSISEVIRFGTARLVAGTAGSPMQGSQIRIGQYVG